MLYIVILLVRQNLSVFVPRRVALGRLQLFLHLVEAVVLGSLGTQRPRLVLAHVAEDSLRGAHEVRANRGLTLA